MHGPHGTAHFGASAARARAARLDVDRQSGRHAVLTKLCRNPVTIPVHKGRTLKEGTARAILKQAGISESALFDVY